MVIPNIATLSFSVETNASEAQDAISKNAQMTQGLLTTLKAIRGEEDEIETSRFTLSPVYEKDKRTRPAGYRVSNTVIVETKNMEKVGNFIDEAAKAGVGRIGNLACIQQHCNVM